MAVVTKIATEISGGLRILGKIIDDATAGNILIWYLGDPSYSGKTTKFHIAGMAPMGVIKKAAIITVCCFIRYTDTALAHISFTHQAFRRLPISWGPALPKCFFAGILDWQHECIGNLTRFLILSRCQASLSRMPVWAGYALRCRWCTNNPRHATCRRYYRDCRNCSASTRWWWCCSHSGRQHLVARLNNFLFGFLLLVRWARYLATSLHRYCGINSMYVCLQECLRASTHCYTCSVTANRTVHVYHNVCLWLLYSIVVIPVVSTRASKHCYTCSVYFKSVWRRITVSYYSGMPIHTHHLLARRIPIHVLYTSSRFGAALLSPTTVECRYTHIIF